LVGIPESERLPERPRHRLVDNIKMDLVEKGWGGVNSICLVQDRHKWRVLVKAVMNLMVP
jgi:hypothetical protein